MGGGYRCLITISLFRWAMALLGLFRAEADAFFDGIDNFSLSVNDTIVVDRFEKIFIATQRLNLKVVVLVCAKLILLHQHNSCHYIVLVSLLIWGPASTYYFALIFDWDGGLHLFLYLYCSNILISWKIRSALKGAVLRQIKRGLRRPSAVLLSDRF